MKRLIWSVGVVGLALACVASALLRHPDLSTPVEPQDFHVEPTRRVERAAVAPRPPALTHTQPPPSAPPQPPLPDEPEPLEFEAPSLEQTQAAPSVRARRPLSESRKLLVQALRGAPAEPNARRSAVLASLESTGVSQEPWTAGAREALDAWRQRMTTSIQPVEAEPPRCFAAGCVTRVTFPDAATHDAAFRLTPELRLPGNAAHLQLPAEHLASGQVLATWVVLRPDTP
ncbi:hypothetical protein LXT21_10445 [Myxococcus sp. K38C18041901]|uniref:hypothetical protein n=1 Tax=Myxococcus guangdongensis TaxID=2906760 RepID=UPI0020A8374B|nr:hypothetical protein [Myxococcus guangdongensis]MCP3059191.1 hypothetical protein [Myxococcus guangdongensis]